MQQKFDAIFTSVLLVCVFLGNGVSGLRLLILRVIDEHCFVDSCYIVWLQYMSVWMCMYVFMCVFLLFFLFSGPKLFVSCVLYSVVDLISFEFSFRAFWLYMDDY